MGSRYPWNGLGPVTCFCFPCATTGTYSHSSQTSEAGSRPCRGDGVEQRLGNTWGEWKALDCVSPVLQCLPFLFSSTSPLDVTQNCEASGLGGGGLKRLEA